MRFEKSIICPYSNCKRLVDCYSVVNCVVTVHRVHDVRRCTFLTNPGVLHLKLHS